jgi:hypothetical protein
MRFLRCVSVALVLAAAATPAQAEPVLIDFESFADAEELGAQFDALGITFAGATALASGAVGGSLNEFDFPPSSGNVVAFDSGLGGITIDFLRPTSLFTARFTYVAGLTVTAYSGAAVVGTAQSLFDQNFGSSGNPANELLSILYGPGITRVTIAGLPDGGSFIIDDINLDLQETTAVPEPATAALMLLGLAASTLYRRRRA